MCIRDRSTPGFRVSVTVNNTVSTTEVSAAASPTDGVFLADYRYTVPLVLNLSLIHIFSPGRYLFTVRGCNSDGIWSDRTARIEVRILPPWWLSWWAYLIYGVLVAVVIVVAYNRTLTKMKLLAELRLEKLERMKTEELNQVKMRFFTNRCV